MAARAALINSATNALNVIDVDASYKPPNGYFFILSDDVQMDWTYAKGQLQPPVPTLPTAAELTVYASQKQTAFLAAGQTFNVAASGAAANVLCDGTSSTRADLAMLALYGQVNPTGIKTWIDNTGAATILTGTQLIALATLAGEWIDDTYAAFGALLVGVKNGSVTTFAQIDAFVWPTT